MQLGVPRATLSTQATETLLTAGLADYFGISALLSCMFLGVTLSNRSNGVHSTGRHINRSCLITWD